MGCLELLVCDWPVCFFVSIVCKMLDTRVACKENFTVCPTETKSNQSEHSELKGSTVYT